MSREVERLERTLSDLVHDLRNLMAGMDATWSASAAPDVRDVTFRELRLLIQKAESSLALSRLSRGALDLERDSLPLRSLLRKGLRDLAPFLGARRLSWEVEGDATALADRGTATTMLASLLLTAVRATGEGDLIRVRAELVEGRVQVTVDFAADPLTVEQRLKRLLSLEDDSGIGLGVARELARKQGGDLEAGTSTAEPERTRLVLRLPAEGAGEEEVESAAERPGGPLSVLVVDDQRDAAKSLAMLLSLAGHDTDVRHDGRSALEAVRKRAPDVVLLDLGLPDIDGYEVCRLLRETEELRGLTLVAVSGRGDDRARELSRQAGFDALLLKPIDRGELTALLARANRRPKLAG